MHEEDSGLVRWGLRLLDGDPGSHSDYYGDHTQHDADIYGGPYLNGFYDMESSNVENDEIIAHTLQEELSQLAITEAPESSHEEDHSETNLVQEWSSQPMGNYYSDHESGQEETDDRRPSSSCSSPGEISYDGEEYSSALELDESILDGEVGKRLNQMTPIPHIPRINGDIPSTDEATSDHQRLLDRLQSYGLIELKVQGDGNCQFRALSDQFYRSPEHHKFVRRQVVNQLKSHRELYEGYVPMGYGDYLRKMSKSGEWGDHVTLQAAADTYGVRILVITSFKDRCKIEILPKVQKSERVIFLSFWSEVHYNSIYPQEDLLGEFNLDIFSSDDPKKKKKWWNFGNKH